MKRWILLVEEQPDDVFLFELAANKAGIAHEIELAGDGCDAIARLQRMIHAARAAVAT